MISLIGQTRRKCELKIYREFYHSIIYTAYEGRCVLIVCIRFGRINWFHLLLKCLYQARKLSSHVFVFCIFVVSTLPFYVIFLLDFGTVSGMWYVLYFILFFFYLFQKHEL